MGESASFPPDEIERIFAERAQRLARPKEEERPEETLEVLVMKIGEERYGLDLRHIREVQPVGSVTPVPGLPAIWAGITTLRGVLHPVLDPSAYLGVDRGEGPGRYLLVLSSPHADVGVLAEDVLGLRSISPQELEPPLEAESGLHRKAVSAVTGDLLLLLDVETLLQDPMLVVAEKAS